MEEATFWFQVIYPNALIHSLPCRQKHRECRIKKHNNWSKSVRSFRLLTTSRKSKYWQETKCLRYFLIYANITGNIGSKIKWNIFSRLADPIDHFRRVSSNLSFVVNYRHYLQWACLCEFYFNPANCHNLSELLQQTLVSWLVLWRVAHKRLPI